MLASSLLMFFYKIDGKTKKLMREELAARRKADNPATDTALGEDGGESGDEQHASEDDVCNAQIEQGETLDEITAEKLDRDLETPSDSGREK